MSFLVGASPTQVCVGEHQAILRFDNEATVTIESSWTVTRSEASRTRDRPAESADDLARFLASAVATTERIDSKTLRLVFDDRASLDLHDSNAPELESFQITFGDRVIVV